MASRAKLSPSKSSSASSAAGTPPGGPKPIAWRSTNTMNMRDLSRDDDFLSHLFVEKLGTGVAQLLVHKMDPLRRLPKTDPHDIFALVQRLIRARVSADKAIKQAVTELLTLHSIQYFLRDYEPKQINAFATHSSRYLELFLPNGSIEIAQTSRYSKYTGKNELCILATRALPQGAIIHDLKGSMADLTDDEDRSLKRTGPRDDGGIRRDFSVIHSKQLKKSYLFLGPARFVNHDCDYNCELFRSGRIITFRVIKPIAAGQEVTAYYGDGYFGRNNRHCLCETCERLCRGGYAPQTDDDASNHSGSDSDSDSDSSSETSSASADEPSPDAAPVLAKLNVNERRTRRGVYLTLPDSAEEDDSGESDAEGKENDDTPKAGSSSMGGRMLPPSLPLGNSRGHQSSGTDGALARTESQSGASSSNSTPTSSRVLRSHQVSASASVSIISTRSRSCDVNAAVPSVSASATPETEQRILKARKSEPMPFALTLRSNRGRANRTSVGSTSVDIKADPEKEKSQERRVLRGSASQPNLKGKEKESKAAGKQPQKTAEAPVAAAAKAKVPTGPVCKTCSTPLPPPPVDPNAPRTTPKRGKKEVLKEDCARCKRHLAIFGAVWPSRVPSAAPINSTPGDVTPSTSQAKVMKRDLTALDSKLKALSNPRKGQREHSEERESHHSRKQESIKKVQEYRRKQQKLSRSGRHSVPTIKIRLGAIQKKKADEKTIDAEGEGDEGDDDRESQPRQNDGRFGLKPGSDGRYKRRLSATSRSARLSRSIQLARARECRRRNKELELEQELANKLAIDGVGASGNGTPSSPSLSDLGSPVLSSALSSASESSSGKRLRSEEPPIASSSKKARVDDEADEPMDDVDDRRDKTFWPVAEQPPLPPVGLGYKRLGLLNHRPNPMMVSRWRGSSLQSSPASSVESTPQLLEDDTDDAADSPERLQTPEPEMDVDASDAKGSTLVDDSASNPPESSTLESDRASEVPTSPPRRSKTVVLRGLGLFSRPNPIALSKRTWAPAAVIVDDDDDDLPDITDPLRDINNIPAPGENPSDWRIGLDHDVAMHDEFDVPPPSSLKGPLKPPANILRSPQLQFDEDASSGEEDVILPYQSTSVHFTLQAAVSFPPQPGSPSAKRTVHKNRSDDESTPKASPSKSSASSSSAGNVTVQIGPTPSAQDKDTISNTSTSATLHEPFHFGEISLYKLRPNFISKHCGDEETRSNLTDAGWETASEASVPS